MDHKDRRNIFIIWIFMIPYVMFGHYVGTSSKLFSPDVVAVFTIVGYVVLCSIGGLMYAYLQGAFERKSP